MKKLFICTLVLLCSGCRFMKQEEPVESKPYFLFATPLSNHTLWLQAKEGMDAACNKLDVYCDWIGPIKISIPEMEDVIQSGIMKKADGIITQGVVSKELIEEGMSQNIPFVLVDSKVVSSEPLATISKDFDQQAEILLADIEKKIGEETFLKIGIQVSDKTFDLATSQIKAIEKAFKKHKGGFQIMSITESKSDKLHSKNEWIQTFQTQRNINVAINLAGENASGCVEAKEYTNNKDNILIYGVDDMEDTIQLIKDKKIEGSVVTSFYGYGYQAVQTLYNKVELGLDPAQADIAAKVIIIDGNNLTTYKNELK